MIYQFWNYYRDKRQNELPLGLIILVIVIVFFAVLTLTHVFANSSFFEAVSTVSTATEIKNKLQNPGLLGDSAGIANALFSALALGGVVYTVYLQRKEIDSNQKDGAIDKFETKFYEMIHLHKQNVDEIHVGELKGREAIEKLLYDLQEIFKKVESAITTIQSTNPPVNESDELTRFRKMKEYLSDPKKRLNYIHELSYGYFFYGIANYFVTKNKLDVRYDINLDVTALLIMNKMKKDLVIPRNSLLGHYYRHLYQTVQFVAKDDIVKDENKKYNYIKLLRAQLSDFEQTLLYYNSLSVMGAKWIEPLGKRKIEDMCYIARFRLIKNMPYYFNYFGQHPGNLFKVEKEIWELKEKKFFEIDLD